MYVNVKFIAETKINAQYECTTSMDNFDMGYKYRIKLYYIYLLVKYST